MNKIIKLPPNAFVMAIIYLLCCIYLNNPAYASHYGMTVGNTDEWKRYFKKEDLKYKDPKMKMLLSSLERGNKNSNQGSYDPGRIYDELARYGADIIPHIMKLAGKKKMRFITFYHDPKPYFFEVKQPFTHVVTVIERINDHNAIPVLRKMLVDKRLEYQRVAFVALCKMPVFLTKEELLACMPIHASYNKESWDLYTDQCKKLDQKDAAAVLMQCASTLEGSYESPRDDSWKMKYYGMMGNNTGCWLKLCKIIHTLGAIHAKESLDYIRNVDRVLNIIKQEKEYSGYDKHIGDILKSTSEAIAEIEGAK